MILLSDTNHLLCKYIKKLSKKVCQKILLSNSNINLILK